MSNDLFGDTPCEHCPRRELCETGAACHDFWVFVETGRVIYKNRLPTTQIYDLIFNTDDALGVCGESDVDVNKAWFDFIRQSRVTE